MSNKGPDRFGISKKNKKLYDKLKARDSPFTTKENSDLFMAALMVGYYEVKKPMELQVKLGYAQKTTFSDKDLSIINSIAVKEEGSLDVLLNKSKVVITAEQYANAGIELLVDKVFNGEYGDFLRRLESDLVDEFEKNIKIDIND